VRPALTTGMAKNPLPFWLLGGIGINDVWLAGSALVGALLEACLDNGVDVRVEATAVRLVIEESEVKERSGTCEMSPFPGPGAACLWSHCRPVAGQSDFSIFPSGY